ncbi:MAG: hypothetical protein AAGE76_16145 [Pseudomonadota bacterium]
MAGKRFGLPFRESTAAEVLNWEHARGALRQFAQSDGIYTAAEELYDPTALPENSRKARVLRKLREATDQRFCPEVEAYILDKPDVIQVAVAPTKIERFGFVSAIVAAVLLAPIAIIAALLALSNPAFTGFSDTIFPIALAEHLVWYATQGELMGYVAAASMLITFSMKNQVMLRLFAVIANVFFISYGIGAHLVPVVLLHMILLPINITHLSRALHNQGARAWGAAPQPVPVRAD